LLKPYENYIERVLDEAQDCRNDKSIFVDKLDDGHHLAEKRVCDEILEIDSDEEDAIKNQAIL
jgi:hypothetical protein